MADAYLILAEKVLLKARHPLTPREILDKGYAEDLVPWHLHGETQHKTLHARLSEDVSLRHEQSKFFRTGPGAFFLKTFLDDPSIPDSYKDEFFAPPRRKELKKEAVLALDASCLAELSAETNKISVQHLTKCLEGGRYSFRSWREVENYPELVPVHSFLIVHKDTDILSYRSGKFRPASDPLYGTCSIGFGGVVQASDVDLVFNSFFGIIGNGINELVSSVGLTRRLAEKARYRNQVRSHLAMLVRGKGAIQWHLYVVLTYLCPKEFHPVKNALSLNDLKWVSAHQKINDLTRYDPTSRYLLEGDMLAKLTTTEPAANHYG